MKLKQLIQKAEALFDATEHKRKERRKSIKKVLKKLRKYEKSLAQQLLNETNQEAASKLEKKLALTHMHRTKGLEILNEIKAERNASNPEQKIK